MNWDRIEGNWKQIKGTLKEKWGKLTDDEFDQIAGKRDRLGGKIQERYGINGMRPSARYGTGKERTGNRASRRDAVTRLQELAEQTPFAGKPRTKKPPVPGHQPI
jgi:uncharacterized protein YjbJ (UPF0337 family)